MTTALDVGRWERVWADAAVALAALLEELPSGDAAALIVALDAIHHETPEPTRRAVERIALRTLAAFAPDMTDHPDEVHALVGALMPYRSPGAAGVLWKQICLDVASLDRLEHDPGAVDRWREDWPPNANVSEMRAGLVAEFERDLKHLLNQAVAR